MRRVLAIGGGLAVIGLCGFLLRNGLERADQWSSVLGMLFGLASLVWGVFGGRAVDVETAQRKLADAVLAQWRREVAIRSLRRPEPVPVRWSSTGRRVQARPAAILGRDAHHPVRLRLRGEVKGIVESFRRLPRRHLVVLGDPGSGKTVLAMLLVVGLLEDPREGEPVPVMLPLSSWDPRIPLHTWMAGRIAADHPSLPQKRINELLETGRIMPVLDGLDEIDPGLQGAALTAIDRSIGRTPLMVTCRGDEYETAVRSSGVHLSRAAVIELQSIKARETALFIRDGLRDGDDRWDPVLAELRDAPDGTLADALSTPLMADMARTVYERPGSDPSELVAFQDRTAVEDHLLDAFVPAVYADSDPERARRWLSYLAGNMNRLGTRDLSWWQIRSPIVAVPATALFTIGTWLYFGLWFTAGERVIGTIVVAICVMGLYLYGSRVWDDRIERDPKAVDPHGLLARRRVKGALWSAFMGLISGCLSFWYASGGSLSSARSFLLVGTVVAAFTVAGLLSSTWGSFLVCRLWLAATGRLPFWYARFIRGAHAKGVLLQAGTVYQFRHARLQERLSRRPYASAPPQSIVDDKLISTIPVRVFAPILAIFVVASFAGWRRDVDALTYASGDAPRNVIGEKCAMVDTCIPNPQFIWTLPPHSTLATRFTVKQPPGLVRPDKLNLDVSFKDCPGATIEIRLADTGETAHVTVPRKDFLTATPTPAELALPPRTTHIELALSRRDDLPCSTTLQWNGPFIKFTYLLKTSR